MAKELFFEIPNKEAATRIIGAVPPEGLHIHGRLFSPEGLIFSGMVEENTGYLLKKCSLNGEATIVGWRDYDWRGWRKPNFFGIIAEQKLPAFIVFDETGLNYPEYFEVGKNIAVGFVRKGYHGFLRFFRKSNLDHPVFCSMSFDFQLETLKKSLYDFDGTNIDTPWWVRLIWRDDEEKKITPIINLCHDMNLREFCPKLKGD